jgi:hypothetical protein
MEFFQISPFLPVIVSRLRRRGIGTAQSRSEPNVQKGDPVMGDGDRQGKSGVLSRRDFVGLAAFGAGTALLASGRARPAAAASRRGGTLRIG